MVPAGVNKKGSCCSQKELTKHQDSEVANSFPTLEPHSHGVRLCYTATVVSDVMQGLDLRGGGK